MERPPSATDPSDGRERPPAAHARAERRLRGRRAAALRRLTRNLDPLMTVLGVVWLALLVVELAGRSSPALQTAGVVVWGVFVADFALELALAPRKLAYLRKHWATVVSLVLPAFRVFRALRALRFLRAGRAVRGARLLRVVTSINRGVGSLRVAMRRRRAGFVAALTVVVVAAGSAGIYALEKDEPGGFRDLGTTVWCTAMIVASVGTDSWPTTLEGRILTFLLTLYGFAMFGYLTATLATWFLGQDQADAPARDEAALAALTREVAALRKALEARGLSDPGGAATDDEAAARAGADRRISGDPAPGPDGSTIAARRARERGDRGDLR
ncbi:MAG TPA: ion transporter [Planctomycetota bacterium]|nr:ion transporter [Planctomycetota bacterium]